MMFSPLENDHSYRLIDLNTVEHKDQKSVLGTPVHYENWILGYPRRKRSKQVAIFMNRTGKWLNSFADHPLSRFQTAAICKFTPS